MKHYEEKDYSKFLERDLNIEISFLDSEIATRKSVLARLLVIKENELHKEYMVNAISSGNQTTVANAGTMVNRLYNEYKENEKEETGLNTFRKVRKKAKSALDRLQDQKLEAQM